LQVHLPKPFSFINGLKKKTVVQIEMNWIVEHVVVLGRFCTA